jgi:hypothetical protein
MHYHAASGDRQSGTAGSIFLAPVTRGGMADILSDPNHKIPYVRAIPVPPQTFKHYKDCFLISELLNKLMRRLAYLLRMLSDHDDKRKVIHPQGGIEELVGINKEDNVLHGFLDYGCVRFYWYIISIICFAFQAEFTYL